MAPLEHMESVLRAILEMDRPNVVYKNICWTIPPGAAEPRGFCGVCSLFTDPAFIKDLFQKNCYQLGSWGDLKTWARNGCQLCKYIEQEFFKELVRFYLGTTQPTLIIFLSMRTMPALTMQRLL
jgi:hypothetical protein